MSLIGLRLSILGTLTLIIGASTLFFYAILSLIGVSSLLVLFLFVIPFNLIQWLIAPYLIGAMYRVKEASQKDHWRLYETVSRLSKKVGMKMPKVMIANIPLPNAFAYGSPLTGGRVAVTTGLLGTLEEEEVEAVLGHELGHLKHRDVQIMMFVSVLPALLYWIGYTFMLSSIFGGYGGRRNGGGGLTILIGIGAMVMYWVLTMLVLGLSRQREYYADRRNVMVVDDGARKLSEALAKISTGSSKLRDRYHVDSKSFGSFRSLFISDPDRSEKDVAALRSSRRPTSDQELVREVMSRKLSTADRVFEIFSTHPNIVKRLNVLYKLQYRMES